ncbi:MAG: hypothetical protein M4579_006095 [Chaenotheca gracillima]|nr:MAG: hypothetical protein M4579_006095 [Chaenotheca gracillima]
MKTTLSLVALGLGSLAAAAPLEKRALSDADSSTLQLALYLEHLEFALYSGGYAAFDDAAYQADGFPAGFRENVNVIAQHEKTHADTITQVLQENGIAPVPTCTYSFPYSSPKEFVSLSNMITSVGIGAYLGGSTMLTDSATLLTTAGSILTTEARHDSYLRAGAGASPFPSPFDTSLTAVFAYNLAQMFIVSCPQPLPIIVLPKLTLTAPTPPPNLQPAVTEGTKLSFSWDPSKYFVAVDPSAPLYIALINQIAPPVFLEIQKTGDGSGDVAVPANVSGAAFAVLTTFSGPLTPDQISQFGTLAGPAEVLLS